VPLLGTLKAFIPGKFQNHILFAVLVCDFVGSAKLRAGHAACPERRGAARREIDPRRFEVTWRAVGAYGPFLIVGRIHMQHA
jgi:hypothetical protein